MGWTTDDIPDQGGRVAVVTGANGGLGRETVKALAAAGAHVVMAARTPETTEEAADELRRTVTEASYEIVRLDLGDLASVHAAADEILSSHDRIDVLINNAGVMAIPERRTKDGFEMQFGVNHLGHFALTARLFPALLRSPEARVVAVTSTGRFYGGDLDPDNPHLEGRYDPWRAYGQSKMANLRFAIELNRRAAAAGAPVSGLTGDPGFSDSGLQGRSLEASGGLSQRFFHVMVGLVGHDPDSGALPQLRAATDPTATGGELYAARWLIGGSPVRYPVTGSARSEQAGRTLWEVSERETGQPFDVAGMTAESRPG